MADTLLWCLAMAPVVVAAYAYAVYPLLLVGWGWGRTARAAESAVDHFPRVAVVLPCHNEAGNLPGVLASLLEQDYPSDKLHVVVVSDASTDATDMIAGSCAGGAVRLVRLPVRSGKTMAENAARPGLDVGVVVCVDASTRLPPNAVRLLVRSLSDEAVGLVSGRVVSASSGESSGEVHWAEDVYMRYEMWVRSLETRALSIVGASGCFFAMRRDLFVELPADVSRDFASVLLCRSRGLRALQADATCYVSPSRSLKIERGRKCRTMVNGLRTVVHFRSLAGSLGPSLTFQLLSHKIARWVVPLSICVAVPVWVVLAAHTPIAVGVLTTFALIGVASVVAHCWPFRRVPIVLAAAGYLTGGVAAGVLAWLTLLRGGSAATWKPTERHPAR